jgi:ABC-type transport system substrate-binding protein
VEEAKRTLNPARRKALYTEAWSIVNTELPHFHLHEVTQTSAAVKELQGYQPNVVGALTYRSGGLRTAYVVA